MDRSIVYVGALPRSADFLGFEKDALYALGYLGQAVLGSPTCVSGLAIAATSPASLQVTIGAGSIYAMETVDATAFGTLGTDANTVLKQGLLLSPQTLTITPPNTTGYSQVYLVEAAYSDVDSSAIVLPYYNSSNPQQPLNGPGGNGSQQFTVRGGVLNISLKPGSAAPSGSQVAPSVDPGYVGLYTITVSNGQTAISSANWSIYSGAPFIPLTLPQVPVAIQQQSANWAIDQGSANAISISLPASTVLTPGMPLRIKKSATANTGGVTVQVNGGAAFQALWSDGSALGNLDWPASAVGEGVIADDGTYRLKNPISSSVYLKAGGGNTGAAASNHFGVDSSTNANTITASVTPALTAPILAGTRCCVRVANTVTGASTANLGVGGNMPVIRSDTAGALNEADIIGNTVADLEADGNGNWILMNPSLPANRGYRNTLYITSALTWVVPTGVTKIRWKAWAAGGGGGAAPSGSSGGGGAGGAYGCGEQAVVPGQSIAFTPGAGGAAGNGGTNGGNGGNTTVGTFQTLAGGNGGQSVTGTGSVGTGGLPGTGSSGGAMIQSGFAGSSGSSSPYEGGFGGASVFGGSITPIGPGYSGIFPGGGGGGATTNTSPSNGGAAGYIEVEY